MVLQVLNIVGSILNGSRETAFEIVRINYWPDFSVNFPIDEKMPCMMLTIKHLL